jgi:hypothetical protein
VLPYPGKRLGPRYPRTASGLEGGYTGRTHRLRQHRRVVQLARRPTGAQPQLSRVEVWKTLSPDARLSTSARPSSSSSAIGCTAACTVSLDRRATKPNTYGTALSTSWVPNGDVKLGSLFDPTADRETTMRADEWIIQGRGEIASESWDGA